MFISITGSPGNGNEVLMKPQSLKHLIIMLFKYLCVVVSVQDQSGIRELPVYKS